MRRMIGAIFIGLVCCGASRGQFRIDELKEGLARQHAKALVIACEAYYLDPGSGGNFPASLGDLVMPPFGGVGFANCPIFDPWRQPYRYSVSPDGNGTIRVYVWSERVVGGQTRVYGTKPPEPKKQ